MFSDSRWSRALHAKDAQTHQQGGKIVINAVWPDFKSLANYHFKQLFSIWRNFESTLANLSGYWAILHCFKLPKSNMQSGHNGSGDMFHRLLYKLASCTTSWFLLFYAPFQIIRQRLLLPTNTYLLVVKAFSCFTDSLDQWQAKAIIWGCATYL